MTWIRDGNGTRWVDPVPRKRRKPARALRFANLQEGDVLLHRTKWHTEVHEPPILADMKLANDNRRTETKTAVGFALCVYRWFDPVEGYNDPTAGQMVGVRGISYRGAEAGVRRHTLRGLASQGYHPVDAATSDAVLRWMADCDTLAARHTSGEVTLEEARAAFKPWRILMRELGITE